ncbi:hypothetical protein [Cellulomonas sp. JZ18]|uniref:hypothetical protein n=1 Tax=Cellulomonas sp. JZ18 TaxID=2654191 RepID=UPI0018AFF0C1|nr:hypothetical protein [Cellulomonas sp. JZ18]
MSEPSTTPPAGGGDPPGDHVATTTGARDSAAEEAAAEQGAAEEAAADEAATAAAAEEAAKRAHGRELTTLDVEADIASRQAFATSMITTYQGAFERTAAAAETVQKSATAIFALYTGALTLAFSVTDKPLPLRGALPAMFLGAAITFAAGYVAYLGQAAPVRVDLGGESTADRVVGRAAAFGRWSTVTVNRRAHWMRTAVWALLLGVATLPLPFLTLPDVVTTTADCGGGTEQDEQTGACLPTWPAIPTGSAEDVTLRQELLEAQVAEVRDARERAQALAGRTPTDATLVAVCAGVGVLLLGLVFFVRPGRPTDDRTKDAASAAQVREV